MSKFLNDQPFEHTCSNGTTFKGNRCDLSTVVTVEVPESLTEPQLRSDYFEFASWHALSIFNQLNGFAGYQYVKFHHTSFVIVKHAADAIWQHYHSEDPKLGTTRDFSAHSSYSGIVCDLRSVYYNLKDAEQDCERINLSNPSGCYAVCPVK